MSIELYFQNIRVLSKKLRLTSLIELDSTLSATLISDHSSPLIINISYDFDNEAIMIQSHVTTHFPKSRLGVQTIMNKLVDDLLVQKRSAGKLVADPEEHSIQFIKKIDLKFAQEDSLASILPLYSEAALSWREKFDRVTLKSQKESFNREEEILSFNSV
jgi:hypothetical protein